MLVRFWVFGFVGFLGFLFLFFFVFGCLRFLGFLGCFRFLNPSGCISGSTYRISSQGSISAPYPPPSAFVRPPPPCFDPSLFDTLCFTHPLVDPLFDTTTPFFGAREGRKEGGREREKGEGGRE